MGLFILYVSFQIVLIDAKLFRLIIWHWMTSTCCVTLQNDTNTFNIKYCFWFEALSLCQKCKTAYNLLHSKWQRIRNKVYTIEFVSIPCHIDNMMDFLVSRMLLLMDVSKVLIYFPDKVLRGAITMMTFRFDMMSKMYRGMSGRNSRHTWSQNDCLIFNLVINSLGCRHGI